MTSDQIKAWKQKAQQEAQDSVGGGSYWEVWLKDAPWREAKPERQMLVATLENAYQTARLNELLENKAVQITIMAPTEGRLFKEES